MPLAPIWLALPGKRFVFGAIPQLVVLYKVYSQNERFVYVRDNIAWVLDLFPVEREGKFVEPSNW